MRAHIASDIHRDIKFNDWKPPAVDCNLVIIAGDTAAPATLALPWMREAYPGKEIVYVTGNHDFYSSFDKKRPDAGTRTTWEYQKERAPIIARTLGIHLLDDSEAVVNGVRFLGGTLWTDFSCRPSYMTYPEAARAAARAMNDYKAIKFGAGRSGDTIRPSFTIEAHKRTVRFLEQALCTPFDGETVVVTHHAPVPNSLRGWDPARPDAYRELDWCYASNTLNHLFTGEGLGERFEPASIWIHGHIHESRDYTLERTRVVANPRGYPMYPAANAPRENPDFDPHLVIDIEPAPKPACGM